MYYVYILTNVANTVLYVGVTGNLKRRLLEHKNELISGFSRRYHLHKMVYCEEFPSPQQAIDREKQLKKWTRQKKIMLINHANPTWTDWSESCL